MKVVVHSDRPEDFRDLLEARFPDVAFTCCRSYQALPGVLAALRPGAGLLGAPPYMVGVRASNRSQS